MPKNETDNFITKCKQIFTPEVNVTELCQKYKLKADGIYLCIVINREVFFRSS